MKSRGKDDMPWVKFINVGRDRRNWTSQMLNVDEQSLIEELRRKDAVQSVSVEIYAGKIIVGGFRVIGRVEIVL